MPASMLRGLALNVRIAGQAAVLKRLNSARPPLYLVWNHSSPAALLGNRTTFFFVVTLTDLSEAFRVPI